VCAARGRGVIEKGAISLFQGGAGGKRKARQRQRGGAYSLENGERCWKRVLPTKIGEGGHETIEEDAENLEESRKGAMLPERGKPGSP